MHTAVPQHDADVLRRLAEEKARIAALPVHRDRAEMWRRLNDLEPVKPMVWVNEIPWNEFGIEAALQCQDPFCRAIEFDLRCLLHQWEHIQGDMIVEQCMYCPIVIHSTGFGITEDCERIEVIDGAPPSRHYRPQIREEKDVERIQTPEITVDWDATERNHERMAAIVDGIMPVVRRGSPGFWFAPWDQLITWWGVQEAMEDLILRPDLVKRAMERLVNAHLASLDQFERLGLVSLNTDNTRVGSGAYGYTNTLPQPDFTPGRVRANDIWGFATAQIFSDVSPSMHREFALEYENRWLSRFGLNYYGCCEPLHTKLDVIESIPRLRKVSMSPWADLRKAVEQVGRRYVLSIKPNPAILAESVWDPGQARIELERSLDRSRGCNVELVLKDISTVHGEPHRLREWAEIARDLTESFR